MSLDHSEQSRAGAAGTRNLPGHTDVAASRARLVADLFPAGIPRLWCPLLTHYKADGSLDTARIRAHLRHLQPHVGGILAPGSTGDGWEMQRDEETRLVEFLRNECARLEVFLMVGVLRTEASASRDAIQAWLQRFASAEPTASGATTAALARGVCGFALTAPKGADLTQDTIHAELEAAAALGAPLALYQLPQITQNEFSQETFEAIVARYSNVFMLKDTSGRDAVAESGVHRDGVFMVRGAEGAYDRWVAPGGGYDGYLLSTANCFAPELHRIIELSSAGAAEEARALSARVEAVVEPVFAAAAKLDFGNPFANANKAIDHHLAHGDVAAARDLPMTHSGRRLPRKLVHLAGDLLRQNGLAVAVGYLD